MKLSVSIISLNEEDNIERTLEPLQGLADEIIVLDSFSTDRTIEIAASKGAKIYQEPWIGHVGQKNSALEKCTGDWILCLDSDEVLSPELAANIAKLQGAHSSANGYTLKRRTVYMGKPLKYAWQPDKRLRLVRRDANPRWAGTDPHDSLTINGAAMELDGFLLHYSYRNFADHMARTQKYAQTTAEAYFKKGKKAYPHDLMLRPAFALFKRLVLQRALLDGMPGIMAAFSTAFHSYMKYSFLWEMRHSSKKEEK
jgi:glycosyltransferase involved in cell wall biosynthesis